MSLTVEAINDLVVRITTEIVSRMQTEMQSQINHVASQLSTTVEATNSTLNSRISDLSTRVETAFPSVSIEKYEDIEINDGIQCDISLEVVKSVPEFSGIMEKYPSWWQSAKAAIKPFERFSNSNRHYQAVAIIRNKITGAADTVLSSFSTPLNFEAILSRLDHTYSDKRSLRLLEQQLSTLRQARMSIDQYYDTVEKQLTLITNKAIMQYSGDVDSLKLHNNKYRGDALRVFISGLNRPLSNVLFSSRPVDLPTALALAHELQMNQERSAFANAFAERKTHNTIPEVDPSTSRFRNSAKFQNMGNRNSSFRQEAIPALSYANNIPHGNQRLQYTQQNINQRRNRYNNNTQRLNYTNVQNAERMCNRNQANFQERDVYQTENESDHYSYTGDQLNLLSISSRLPFIEKTAGNGQKLKILIDTGAAKNYIKDFPFLKTVEAVKKPFYVSSINGSTYVSKKCTIRILGKETTFFILSNLNDFDGIIGYDFLKEIGASVETSSNEIKYKGGVEPLRFMECAQVNRLEDTYKNIPEEVCSDFKAVVNRNSEVFADPNEALPYNTSVVATIRTTTNEPVYSRSYPYQMSAKDFVDKEVQSILHSGIIRKSRSPYNNPIWVVDKKGMDESDREKTAFSVNNGKYEFCRLSFGLKNAPAIFQRAIDDILRDDIGIRCHVYIDDVIIFSKEAKNHTKDIEIIFKKLLNANMRIALEKSTVFKTSTEFLGFTVSEKGLKTSEDKVRTILEYKEPTTLRSLRAFLGLSGYYRRFIKNYAAIAKPLTQLLRGENGNIGTNQSKNKEITLSVAAKDAFNRLRKILASEDVTLLFPDFSKPFELTTDASSVAIGAVLSQNGKPITFLSRTLTPTEENYATNEREMLAIRWRSFIQEFAPKFHYKPGSSNVVADALSRQHIQHLGESEITHEACTNSQVSLTQHIRTASQPINGFKNQIFLSFAKSTEKDSATPFPGYHRHNIRFKDIHSLHLEVLGKIQSELIMLFPAVRFKHTTKFVIDLPNRDDQLETIAKEHERAHRSAAENYQQILDNYFFPELRQKTKAFVENCRICTQAKYVRHPKKQIQNSTPIPSYPGEILHMDIYSTNNIHFLTCIDKFSKFAIVEPIPSRCIADVKNSILKTIGFFKNPRILVTDNEPSFCSKTIRALIQNQFCMSHHTVSAMHSESNGQVERFHSTLSEISRTLNIEGGFRNHRPCRWKTDSQRQYTIIFLTRTSARLLDYTHAMYIPFQKGNVAIHDDYTYLMHTINLTEFEIIAADINNLEKLFHNQEEKASLEADFNEMNKLLNSLRFHRIKRSINFIGSALKFVAGTPDHSDFVLINERQSRLIAAENQQIEINSEFMKKINELTTQINVLHRNYYSQSNDSIGPNLFQLISVRNQGAISIISINEILLASSVTVYSDRSLLKFLVKIPKIKEICPLVRIFPVVHENIMLNLNNSHIGMCKSGNKPLHLCKESTGIPFCQEDVRDHCLRQIFNNDTATCGTSTAHHIPPVMQIDENTLLIKDGETIVNENGQDVNVNGTCLVIHSNDVFINGTLYPTSIKKSWIEPLTASIFKLKVHIQNLEKISQKTEHVNLQQASYLFSGAILLGIFVITATFYYKHRRQQMVNNEQVDESNMAPRVQFILKQIENNLMQIRDVSV
ncbi:uncharacterized protein LOC119660042 [Hermetia illucens]|uniref:uncharacterized protein LOC119660042 n=1 Tax=Hermetia illucens TaxID=343691 RepID=UPI0018CC46CB|nr:uncharacterized protein LOC119660042 [Hermetia illucens]